MKYDTIIRNGSIVDGSGGAPYFGDVCIQDGVIVAVGHVAGEGVEEIDAQGMLVTPGIVDIHTHYDGQITWDADIAPSCYHGVTTVVVGNCGVGFAPVAPGKEDFLIQLMEGVEDIPGTALHDGISWDWETFPEYLDVLDSKQWTLDVATQLPHGAVRAYVLGDRGTNPAPPTAEELEQMTTITREAIDAGALGVSTSRILAHLSKEGEPVPGTYARFEELWAMGKALKEKNTGIFQIVPRGADGEISDEAASELEFMARVAKACERPVVYSLVETLTDPTDWRKRLKDSEALQAEGIAIYPMVANRSAGILFGLQSDNHTFSTRPSYLAIAGLPLAERVERMRDPAIKQMILSEPAQAYEHPLTAYVMDTHDNQYILSYPLNMEPSKAETVSAYAESRGISAIEACYDLMLENDGKNFFMFPFTNYVEGNLNGVLEAMKSPATVFGLGDGGAHCGVACDASAPTLMLTHWVRDRPSERISIEQAIKWMTADTAEIYGLKDRGMIKSGYRADINIIDLNRLSLETPYMAFDLPSGARRLLQGAKGYVRTMVSGVTTLINDELTGNRPGRLVRGMRGAPPSILPKDSNPIPQTV